MLQQDPTKYPVTVDENQLKARETTNALCKILAHMVNESSVPAESRRPVSTMAMQSALDKRFNCGQTQEDSAEFLTHILNAVKESMPSVKSWHNPADSMCGTSAQTYSCNNCKFKSSPADTPFLLWPIPVPSQGVDNNAVLKLSDLFLNSCVLSERMMGENKYYCSSCREKHECLKYDTLKTPPGILGLQLKRFIRDADTGETTKLMTAIDIDNTLSAFCSDETKSTANYSLFSIVMHRGSGYAGHYFTICRCSGCAASKCSFNSSRSESEWSVLDDIYVSERQTLAACMVEAMERHQNATPYLVFYTREESFSSTTPCQVCSDKGIRIKELACRVVPPLPLSLQQPAPGNKSSESTPAAPGPATANQGGGHTTPGAQVD